MKKLLAIVLVFFACNSWGDPQIKEWTFLVFLNGNNDLDRFGHEDFNEMEVVGTSSQVNVVVQWASLVNGNVKRILVQKDNDLTQATSPVIEDLGQVDMGNYRNLIEFIRWGVRKFPARHYFVAVWDHGTGWHIQNTSFQLFDISWDELTKNSITTKQLGQVMAEAAGFIGRKIDIYGSDACLMAMPEIAHEMTSYVDYFVGSEETAPSKGWPYADLLKRWNEKVQTPQEVAKLLTEEFFKSYQGGSQGTEEVTFSALDLNEMPPLIQSLSDLGDDLIGLSARERPLARQALRATQKLTLMDYADLQDFLNNLKSKNLSGLRQDSMARLEQRLKNLVIANKVSKLYERAAGLSIWLPMTRGVFWIYNEDYEELRFQKETHWADAIKEVLTDFPTLSPRSN